jgi:O-antigen ligase/polysaccharide polymerase Wzy-like membrane protein
LGQGIPDVSAATDSHGKPVFAPLGVVWVIFLALLLGVAILAVETTAVAALAGFMAYLLFVRRPTLGLYATTALLLLSGSAGVLGTFRFGIPITAAKVCGLIAFLAWATHTLLYRKRLQPNLELVLLLAFFAWSALGVLYSDSRDVQLIEWSRLATLVAFFVMAVHLLDSREKLHTFIMLILYCGLFMAAFAVAQYFVPALQLESETAIADIGAGADKAYLDPEAVRGGAAVRVTGRAGHSNWLAMVILLILPLNVYWFMTAQSWRGRSLAVVTVGLEVLALIFTFTRTGFIVGGIILTLMLVRRLVRLTPHRLAALAVLLLMGFFLLPGGYKERVLSWAQFTGGNSVLRRIELQRTAWDMMVDNPIIGVGVGGFGPKLLETNSPVAQVSRWLVEDLDWNPIFLGTHNMYLQLGCETGVVGLSILLIFYGLLLRDLHRARLSFESSGERRGAALTSALEVSLLSFLVCAFFLHALHQKIWWMMAAIAVVIPLYHLSLSEPGTPDKDAGAAADA